MLDDADQWVSRRLGIHLFSHEGLTMAETVGRQLLARQATLSMAALDMLRRNLIKAAPSS